MARAVNPDNIQRAKGYEKKEPPKEDKSPTAVKAQRARHVNIELLKKYGFTLTAKGLYWGDPVLTVKGKGPYIPLVDRSPRGPIAHVPQFNIPLGELDRELLQLEAAGVATIENILLWEFIQRHGIVLEGEGLAGDGTNGDIVAKYWSRIIELLKRSKKKE